MDSSYFNHERLTCYQLAVGIARWIRSTPFGEANLQDQARRASSSVVLNIAEGTTATGKNRRKHFNYAAASAAEVSAVLDILDLPNGTDRQQELRRITQMLHKLR